MRMLNKELINMALQCSKGRTIKDLRVGLGYTAAVLDNEACGLAYTFRNELGHCCSVLPEAGRLEGKSCEEVIPWLEATNLVKAAIGLAVINAILNQSAESAESGNVVNAITVEPGETFGMVGGFEPILHAVRQQTENIYVFERGDALQKGQYSSLNVQKYLPQCDVVVITATSLLNHTMEQILPLCAKARQVCIVGPSTPLVPEIFRPYPVTLLAGSLVTDESQLLRIVSQGGGTMHMKPAIRHVLVEA